MGVSKSSRASQSSPSCSFVNSMLQRFLPAGLLLNLVLVLQILVYAKNTKRQASHSKKE